MSMVCFTEERDRRYDRYVIVMVVMFWPRSVGCFVRLFVYSITRRSCK